MTLVEIKNCLANLNTVSELLESTVVIEVASCVGNPDSWANLPSCNTDSWANLPNCNPDSWANLPTTPCIYFAA